MYVLRLRATRAFATVVVGLAGCVSGGGHSGSQGQRSAASSNYINCQMVANVGEADPVVRQLALQRCDAQYQAANAQADRMEAVERQETHRA